MGTPSATHDVDVQALLSRQAIIDTITTLFVATDARDWDTVRACFTPEVHFDMTSLIGGEPRTMTAEAIAAGWEQGLRPIEAVHHQAGNFRVDVRGSEASAFCYGVAYHYRRHPSGRNTRVFVGSYDVVLREERERWRIHSFRFVAKFVDGNLELESDH
ncbi:MAG: nuclear transport factor 2 family protein [Gemmatimonadaceae bacterium]